MAAFGSGTSWAAAIAGSIDDGVGSAVEMDDGDLNGPGAHMVMYDGGVEDVAGAAVAATRWLGWLDELDGQLFCLLLFWINRGGHKQLSL